MMLLQAGTIMHYVDQAFAPVVSLMLAGIGVYCKFRFDRYQAAALKRTELLAKKEEEKAQALILAENNRREELVAQDAQRNRIEDTLNALVEVIGKMAEQVATVEHEVKENSGLSLKDGVNHIRRELRVGMAVRRQALNVATFESIIMKDGKSHPIAVSEAWTRLTGQSLDQVEGNGWLKAVHPNDRQRVLVAARDAQQSGTELDVLYTNVNVVSGVQCAVRHIAHPVCDPDSQNIIGWFGKLLVLRPPPHYHRRANDDPLSDLPTLDAPTPDLLSLPSGKT